MTTPPPPDAARAAFEAEFPDAVTDRHSPENEFKWSGFRAAYRLMAKDAELWQWLRLHSYVDKLTGTIGFGPGFNQHIPELLDEAVRNCMEYGIPNPDYGSGETKQ